jgi:hypothetical protein
MLLAGKAMFKGRLRRNMLASMDQVFVRCCARSQLNLLRCSVEDISTHNSNLLIFLNYSICSPSGTIRETACESRLAHAKVQLEAGDTPPTRS